jgi:undecaprenyl-diphosphatase
VSELEAFLLGLVQGLTEFLPVSSSGHLVIAQALMGVVQEGVLFEVAVHVATLVSVLVFYRRRVAELVVGVLRGQAEAWRYAAKLALATLPAVVVALAFGDWLESLFDAPAVAGVCLLVTGAILWTTRYTAPPARGGEPGWGAALLIGCAQAFAILPGISRSGTTVAAALALGVSPVAAAEFSFLMSVPAISGAAVRMLPEIGRVTSSDTAPILIGSVAAMVSGVLAIWLFVRLLRTRSFHRFAYYTWAAGGLFLVWLALGRGA